MNIENEITQHLTERGASLIGFADLTDLPGQVRGDLPNAVAFAVGLNPEIVAGIAEGPTKEYLAEYERANVLLGELSDSVAELLRRQGFAAVSSAATHEGVDGDTLSTVLPQKTVRYTRGIWMDRQVCTSDH